MYKKSLLFASALLCANGISYAAETHLNTPIANFYELHFNNPNSLTPDLQMNERTGGVSTFSGLGSNCRKIRESTVITDVQIIGFQPDTGGNVTNSLGVDLYYPDNSLLTLFRVEPKNTGETTYSNHLTGGIIAPPDSQICFFGLVNNSQVLKSELKSGSILGYRIADKI
jgi:hypothetical protein